MKGIKNYTEGTTKQKSEQMLCNLKASFNDLSKTFFSSNNLAILPGLCDVHVHFRQPGFSYKETIYTGALASAKGGFTAVCTMPNLNPVPDSVKNLKEQTDIIKKDAVISVYPYGAITVGQKGKKLSDLEEIANDVIAFSDDGKGVQNPQMLYDAMLIAKKLNKIIVCHCEDESLINGGYIHQGEYAERNNHLGICSESEYKQVERDLELVRKTRCAYHVCHVSTKETVELIRKAKKEGLDVTCETAPHYLILDDSMLQEDGRFKMNPPIRSVQDRDALIEGVLDGTVDMIATDHAPHSIEEKSKGLKDSVFGIVGIETAFSLMYTYFVKTKKMTMEHLVKVMSINPAKRFNINLEGDYSIWDLDKQYTINPSDFISMGKSTPFSDYQVYAKNHLTVKNGKIVYQLDK